jgi:lipoate---protein ligase
MPSWRIEHHHGSAADLHARELSGTRTATFFSTEVPTLVLGSSQPAESVDDAAVQRWGLATCRRRSGGGGVLLWPGEYVWLDVEIPPGDPLWREDVGAAAWWAGELWREALGPLTATATVHRGRMVHTSWSAAVCFAGVGPGEVLIGAAKLVGVSQRRTRLGARFQTMVHRAWRPELMASLVSPPLPTEPLPAVVTCPLTSDEITSRLLTALQHL